MKIQKFNLIKYYKDKVYFIYTGLINNDKYYIIKIIDEEESEKILQKIKSFFEIDINIENIDFNLVHIGIRETVEGNYYLVLMAKKGNEKIIENLLDSEVKEKFIEYNADGIFFEKDKNKIIYVRQFCEKDFIDTLNKYKIIGNFYIRLHFQNNLIILIDEQSNFTYLYSKDGILQGKKANK